MLYARRTLRGVLLFALALFFTTALKAQSVFRWTESGPVARKALAPDADFRAPVAALPSFDAFALINLEAKNKRGRSILAARQRVLEILSSANACSEWFAQLGSDPLHTFRTLTFALDQKAEEHVIERTNAGKLEVRASPYVAKVAQDGGESQTVTLNAGGAFFQSVSNVIRLAKEGGPAQNHGSRPLRVGRP